MMVYPPSTEHLQPVDSNSDCKVTYTVPAYHHLDISTPAILGLAQASPLVSFRLLPSMAKSSLLGSTILGIPLLPNVLYNLDPGVRTSIFCLHDAHVEIVGKPSSVTVSRSNAATRLEVISSVLRNQRLEASRKLHDFLELGPVASFPLQRLGDVSSSGCTLYSRFLHRISTSLLRSSSKSAGIPPCVVILGRGSFSVAQSLYGSAQQDGHFPTYVELDPAPQSMFETFCQLESCVFPPGCVGLSTARASLGLRCPFMHSGGLLKTSNAKKTDTVSKNFASILGDADGYHYTCSGFSNGKVSDGARTMLSPTPLLNVPVGRMCYYLGHACVSEAPAVYNHFMRLIAASRVLQCGALLQSASLSRVMERDGNETERQEYVCRIASGVILHVPESLPTQHPSLWTNLMNLFHVTAILVSDHPSLAAQLTRLHSAPTAATLHHQLSAAIDVLEVYPLDTEAVRLPLANASMLPEASSSQSQSLLLSLSESCKRSWEMYFLGPVEDAAFFEGSEPVPLQLSRGFHAPHVLSFSLSTLKFVTFCSKESQPTFSDQLQDAVNDVYVVPVSAQSVDPIDLQGRVVAIVVAAADNLTSAVCVPISCFVWIKKVERQFEETSEASDWTVTIVSTVALNKEFFDAPTTFCCLPCFPFNSRLSTDRVTNSDVL